jgi:hypothetical protein
MSRARQNSRQPARRSWSDAFFNEDETGIAHRLGGKFQRHLNVIVHQIWPGLDNLSSAAPPTITLTGTGVFLMHCSVGSIEILSRQFIAGSLLSPS